MQNNKISDKTLVSMSYPAYKASKPDSVVEIVINIQHIVMSEIVVQLFTKILKSKGIYMSPCLTHLQEFAISPRELFYAKSSIRIHVV